MSRLNKGLGDTTFDNEFDLLTRELSELELRETNDKDKCIVWDLKDIGKAYHAFVLSRNSQSKIICELNFYKSSETGKYLPRPTFKKVGLDNKNKESRGKNIIISFNKSEDAIPFWKLFGFLSSYKELVDLGEFERRFQVVAKDKYFLEFENKNEKEKVEDLKGLIKIADLTSEGLKDLTFESRKRVLRGFYLLLKNKEIHKKYSQKYKLPSGEEIMWHHFLKSNDWILGLNADLRFISEFLDEQKVGIADSKGGKSPQTDMVGISEFTVLVELKHPNTNIFKEKKNRGRANTWDFSNDFIEGISQCLGQKISLEKSFIEKDFLKSDGTRLSKDEVRTIDPKTIFLIGNKKREFPTDKLQDLNLTKLDTFERFRRNNRNIDVLTYDELFERAYQIVFTRKLERNWYELQEREIFVQ